MGRIGSVLAVMALLTSTAFADDSSAEWPPADAKFIGGRYINVMLEQAARHFDGQRPACGTILVLLYNESIPNVQARSDITRCWIGINRRYWRSGWRRDNPIEFCDYMTHEYGHLLGLQHSDDPTDVMYPTVANDTDECSRIYDALADHSSGWYARTRPWRWITRG